MNISGLVSGGILMVLGLLGIMFGIYLGMAGFMPMLMGIIVTCTGAYMILNSEKENKIEQIKRTNKRK